MGHLARTPFAEAIAVGVVRLEALVECLLVVGREEQADLGVKDDDRDGRVELREQQLCCVFHVVVVVLSVGWCGNRINRRSG